jgi:hypothetical protein
MISPAGYGINGNGFNRTRRRLDAGAISHDTGAAGEICTCAMRRVPVPWTAERMASRSEPGAADKASLTFQFNSSGTVAQTGKECVS